MNFTEYKESLQKPLSSRTVTFLIKDNEVCLGLKKRGFGKGYYLGIGGKIEEKDNTDSDQEELTVARNAAYREISEEIGVAVLPQDLTYMGLLKFYFPHITDESWNQQVYVFTTTTWQGKPTVQKDQNGQVEIEPKWVKKATIPFDHMWDDARFWLPDMLKGNKLDGEFIFDKNLKITHHSLHKFATIEPLLPL